MRCFLNSAYFGQGEDLALCLEKTNGGILSAFYMQAEILTLSAYKLRRISDIIGNRAKDCKISGYGTYVEIDAPEDVVNDLVHEELVSLIDIYDASINNVAPQLYTPDGEM